MVIEEEDYVSFETAKLLEEKGFDKPCRAKYGSGGSFSYERFPIGKDECKKDNCILAPTIQMALKWLRDNNIFIDIFHYNSNMAPYVWLIFAYNFDTPHSAKKYEEAAEDAIMYVLKNWDEINKVLDKYYKYDDLLPKI